MRPGRQLVEFLLTCVLIAPPLGADSLQDPPPTSAPAAASPEVETFVRDALRDRLLAGDIPDIGLLRRTEGKPILVRADVPESRTQLTSQALPSVPGTELQLITLAEAQRVVARTSQPLHLLAVDHVRVAESDAAMWLGVDLVVPAGSVKLSRTTRNRGSAAAD